MGSLCIKEYRITSITSCNVICLKHVYISALFYVENVSLATAMIIILDTVHILCSYIHGNLRVPYDSFPTESEPWKIKSCYYKNHAVIITLSWISYPSFDMSVKVI